MELYNLSCTKTILLFISLVCLFTYSSALDDSDGPDDDSRQGPINVLQNWPNHGGDLQNRRYASGEVLINPLTVSQLRLKWKFDAGDDITATPAISDGIIYFPSWNGLVYAVRAFDGSLLWKKNLTEITGLTARVSQRGDKFVIGRGTPTVANDLLLVGIYGPAYIVALRRMNGQLVWMKQLDAHPFALVTMSGTYFQNGFYVGVSSLEENSTVNCCTFRGSFVKLNVRTGSILWQTYMLPDNNGQTGKFAGGAIWGSSPSIDERRNHVYIATGNLYSVPQDVDECQQNQNNQTVPTGHDTCIPSNVHYESILALDLKSGQIKWARQLGGYDVWVLSCVTPTFICPTGPNPDADFGEAPMMLTIEVNRTLVDAVVTVQKSGFTWALNRNDGNLIWSTVSCVRNLGCDNPGTLLRIVWSLSEQDNSTQFTARVTRIPCGDNPRRQSNSGNMNVDQNEAGPGGTTGGGIWGAATDTRRVYTNIANSQHKIFTLLPSSSVTTGGGWVAMDPGSGQILWSTAVPNNAITNPVTIANGVLFAGSTFGTGPFYAINAATGKILWSYETGGSIYGGASVSRGCAYVGHGWRGRTGFTAGQYLHAFCIF